MAKKSAPRKTSTSKLVASPAPTKDLSVSVRKISNGFLISESGTKGSGRNAQWYTKETFSSTNPIKLSR